MGSVNRKKKSGDKGLTVARALSQAEAVLASVGVEAPAREAQELLAHAWGMPRARLLASLAERLTRRVEARFAHWIRQREKRVPLQYLLGEETFCGRVFKVGPGVLIPRPETELLVQEALARVPVQTAAWIADLGTGSGILALTLAGHYPAAQVYGVDLSPRALAWARLNRRRLQIANCRFFEGDAAAPLPAKLRGRFSLVVSNPPYIPHAELAHLQPEVQFEPRLALDGGKQGHEAIEHMLRAAARLLAPGGVFACEVGIHQAAVVEALFARHGFVQVRQISDWQQIPRILSGVRASA